MIRYWEQFTFFAFSLEGYFILFRIAPYPLPCLRFLHQCIEFLNECEWFIIGIKEAHENFANTPSSLTKSFHSPGILWHRRYVALLHLEIG